MVRRGPNSAPRVLLLAERPRSALWLQLIRAGYDVIETFSTDRAVAVCVNNPIEAVVLDQHYFVEIDGWSVAQSVKAVRANVCVVLAIRAEHLEGSTSTGVDAVVPAEKPKAVIAELQRLVGKSGITGEIVRTANPLPLSDLMRNSESPED